MILIKTAGMYIVLLFLLHLGYVASGQGTIRDESGVPAYFLPDLLKTQSGEKILTTTQWERIRRPELIRLFEENVYGKTPGRYVPVCVVETSLDSNALDGKAIRKEVTLFFGEDNEKSVHLLLYLPRHVETAVPVFLGLNFSGNQVVHRDPGIALNQRWVRDGEAPAVVNHRATESSRGTQAGDWPVEMILDRGYGLATLFCGDLQPDRVGSFGEGVHPLFYRNGQTAPDPDQWGAIGAWAWGLSRAMDYLETDSGVNAKQVAVIGHSRLGKAALWAGAQDVRFALVISNNSGEGGAAITRRKFGETIAIINKAFPHWFCENYKKFGDREEDLPVDFHQLIALIAPRPVYIASASEDWWADPKGEYLSGHHASPVYELYGLKGLVNASPPGENCPTGTKNVGYHLRKGSHAMKTYDWNQYLDFADRNFRKSEFR